MILPECDLRERREVIVVIDAISVIVAHVATVLATHDGWPRAGISLVGDPVSLYHMCAVETAGLAYHDDKTERISGIFGKPVAHRSFGRSMVNGVKNWHTSLQQDH